jgi:glycosyltransferase involved in cell wall biosynthesis
MRNEERGTENPPVLFIVIPCYNEQEALPITAKRLVELTDDMLEKGLIAPESRIVLVDDGSRDDTWKVISDLHAADPRFEGVKLAHNAGHMNALWAGMTLSAERCDCVITIDADLQDDVNAMYGFLEEYRKGADVVYGVRSSRQKDTLFKRTTAQGFYKMMAGLGVEMVYNHADYRLLSKRALEALLSFGEVNMFLRGMVPMLGFKTAKVYFERGERVAGESKYPLKKMIAFAAEGVTSLSNKPIRWVLGLGAVCALLGLVMAVYVIVSLIRGHTVAGWASMMMSIWLLGGLQLMALGVIGEYVGKVYMETKRRPKFILEEHLK